MKKYIRKYKWQLIWVIGVIVMMFTHINWHYAAVITIGLVAFLIIDSPDIKKIVMNNKGVAIEKQQEKIDKALVEYDEFKNTIYPLLEASMAQIVSVRYLQMPPKSSVMISYVPLVEKAIKSEELDKPEIRELLKAIKAMTLYGFSVELGKIADKSSNGQIEQISVERLINTGLEEDYSKKVYVHTDEIDVNFDALNSIAKNLPDNPDKRRFENRLKQLKSFYKQYYAN